MSFGGELSSMRSLASLFAVASTSDVGIAFSRHSKRASTAAPARTEAAFHSALLSALFAARWIRSFLFGTTTHDPFAYAVAGLLIFVASAVAIALPARRAMGVDPMVALRYE